MRSRYCELMSRLDQTNNNGNDTVISTHGQRRINLTIVSKFKDISSDYDYEKEIKFIKTTYKLENDLAKILIGVKKRMLN